MMSKLANDTRVFDVDPAIEVQNVRFANRYGFNLAGHLYLPKSFAEEEKYQAIAITGPFGAVKEQASGLYAQTLAQHGFVTLAFDQSMTGESSGTRRNVASSDIFVEDFSRLPWISWAAKSLSTGNRLGSLAFAVLALML